MRISSLLLPLLPLVFGCGGTSVAQAWQIDRLRILGVAADTTITGGEAIPEGESTAEPRPGDTVTFRSLVVSPDPVAATIWFACAESASDSYGCTTDPSSLGDLSPEALEGMTPEEQAEFFAELQAAGLIGIDPFLPPTLEVSPTYLDGLDEIARLEGSPVIVNLTAIPDAEEVEEDDVEIAFKRLIVSEAETPNHNPDIIGITVDGIPVPEDGVVTLDRGQSYKLEPILADGAVEDYRYTNADGVVDERTEVPYFNWYLVEGEFYQEFSLYPDVAAEYTTPAAPESETGTIWVVARDRRGGMGWWSLNLRYQ